MRIRTTPKVLMVLWCLALVLIEVIQFDSYASSCLAGIKDKDTALTMGIIGDPQLTDFYSYKQSSLSLISTEFISDLYMRKNFRRFESFLDVVFFTGDLFDGGRVATAAQFEEDLDRFEHVFRNPRKMPFWTVSGNHDVGYSAVENEAVIERFEASFGATHEVT